MNISVTYTEFSIHHLAAIAAAHSQSVKLFKNDKNDGILSMGPHCEKIKSQASIICLILNFNPIDEAISSDILWFTKFIKPTLYHFYKKCIGNIKEKSEILIAQNCLDILDKKFNKQIQNRIRPLELLLWADLYLLLSPHSPLQKNVNISVLALPPTLRDWFNNIDKLSPLRSAAVTVFGEDEAIGLMKAVKMIPELPIHNLIADNDISVNRGDLRMNQIKNTFLYGYATVAQPRVFSVPKLPQADARNVLITSALPYVNNVPHLGNLIGSTLSADVFSRYCRVRGYNSIYVCGTDEYGTATEVKAAEEKTTPREICDKYHKIHAEVYNWFDIDFDIFGRTSDEEHARIVTGVFEDINRRGFILEDCVQQLFCTSCEKFLADRFVEGGCPVCSYEDARGDQCDKCGKLINAIELKNPRCKMCSSSPCIKTSQHLFLDLTKIQEELETFIHGRLDASDCIWSTNAKSITKAWLNEGLKPRCITRDLKWGVKVPLEKFSNKVFYVWFDAVLGYLSITAKYTKDWKQWWLQQESKGEVQLYQFMAKDNVPFHSVILPANLLATGHKYNMLRQLASVEYLNYENDKFSKSRGLGVFGPDAKNSGIEADIWRFYLVSCRPESQDSSFLWEDFAARNNSELLNNLGNFVNRALSFVVKFFDSCIPDFMTINDEDEQFLEEVNIEIAKYVELMEQTKMREAVAAVLNISRLGNGYIQRNKPWVAVKDEQTRSRAATVVGVAANVAVILGVLLCPVMPNVSNRLLSQCQAPANSRQILDDCQLRAWLQPGHKIGDVIPLFTKMEDTFVKTMKERFGSSSK